MLTSSKAIYARHEDNNMLDRFVKMLESLTLIIFHIIKFKTLYYNVYISIYLYAELYNLTFFLSGNLLEVKSFTIMCLTNITINNVQ